jgi:hypothetical protein
MYDQICEVMASDPPQTRTPRSYVPAPPPAGVYEPLAPAGDIEALITEKPPADFVQPLIPAPNDALFQEVVLKQQDILALLQRIT